MYERVELCPVCSADTFSNKLISKDHTVSGESFAIVECDECTHRFTNPRPGVTEIGKFYQAENYISHTDTNKGIINQAYRLVRRYTLRQKLQLIQSLVKHSGVKVLDVGSGTGHFVTAVKNKGWEAIGVEPSQVARDKTKDKGIKIYSEINEITDQGSFDVITMWHVLEHVYTLHEDVRKLKKILKPGGYLVVAVPNHLSSDAIAYSADWAAYDVPRHIQHFNQSSIKKLMRLNKMSYVEQHPMKFDAYYISLISENFKNGIEDKFAALKVAWESNRKAAKNGEYSSLTYVFQKK